MRGRKPVPTTLKLLRGNPGRRPINQDEPQPNTLDTECPPELLDTVARDEWVRSIVPAIGIGHITSADRSLAIAHCELWATWQSQLSEAIKHPHVIAAGKNRYPMPNPARSMANKTLQLLTQVDERLGFSPTSRSRVIASTRSAKKSVDRMRAQFMDGTRG